MVIIFTIQDTGLAFAGFAVRTQIITIGASTAFISADIAEVILTGIYANQGGLALLGMLPGTFGDRTLIIFAAATVRLDNAGGLFASGAAVIVIGPVFRQFVGLAFAGGIFAVARRTNPDITLAVTFIFVIRGALAIRIESQLAAFLTSQRIVITDH